MKRLSVLFVFLCLLFGGSLRAQTRFTVGAAGGQAFDNASLGITAAVEAPFAKHYELDLKDTFSPLESHVSLGGGRANIIKAGGYIWLTNSLGLTASAEDSRYDVTKVAKAANYAFGGIAYRGIVGGLPARFTFQYIRQFNNGISPSGLETSHLQGLDVGYTMRFGCIGAICIRNSEDFVFGSVRTQGNPQCDGEFGTPVTCPRTLAVGGGVTASITVEFPRRRGHENDVF